MLSVTIDATRPSQTPLPHGDGPSTAVCVIVPALNEASYIEACLSSLLRQVGCHIVEIIVADGGSTDGTVEIVHDMARRHPEVRLIHNPARIQSAGINLAAAGADPAVTVLVRADAHVHYAQDFVMLCVRGLQDNGATSVVVPMHTVGRSGFQRAVAQAQNTRIGNGGSAHRIADVRSGFVDHGHHAAFDRRFFEACGGYDESFTHNEDAELDFRAHLAGGRIWMCREACVEYFPRNTPLALARQYVRNGRGRARTLTKHRLRPRLRQLAPVMLMLAVVSGLVLSLAWWPFILVPVAYLALCTLTGVVAAIGNRDAWLLASGPAAAIMHVSYGVGFLQTVVRHALGRSTPLAAA